MLMKTSTVFSGLCACGLVFSGHASEKIDVAVEGPDFSGVLVETSPGIWRAQDVEVGFDAGGRVTVKSPVKRLTGVTLTWPRRFASGARYFCDAWERTEGDSGWYDAPTFSCSPWYTMIWESNGTFHGFGVEVQPGSLVCWKFGAGTLTAVLDVTAGGKPLRLGARTLQAAKIVRQENVKGLSAFAAARQFARLSERHLLCGGRRLRRAGQGWSGPLGEEPSEVRIPRGFRTAGDGRTARLA